MTYVWIYERREEGRPINLRLVRSDQIPPGWHILSARFRHPNQAAAALFHYFDFDTEGFALINDRHAGMPIGWTDQIGAALHVAPWLVGLLLFTCGLSICTFAALLIHIF